MMWLSCLENKNNLKGQWPAVTVRKVPAAILHQIEQELDMDEKETMVFLCRDLVPDLSAPDVRKIFVALNEREELTDTSLAELLYRLKRFDLLRKFLGIGRAAVEASLSRCPQMVSNYRVLLTEINEDLDKDDLDALVFLLMGDREMSYAKMAKDKNFLAIITDLEKLDLVSPDQLDFLENCLRNIHRKDLAKKIQKYQREAPVHTIGTPALYANALQVLPKLTLVDPPGIVSKGRLLNGPYATNAEQVQISIPETGRALAQKSLQVSDQYRMQSRPVGICLIIDCIGNDTGTLVDTFNTLHFEVHCRPFLNADSMMHELYTVAGLNEHKDYDCFVCILISRGDHQSIFCTDHVVPGFPLENVKRFFTGDTCPGLLGKPKLFFIQNYVESGNQQENASLLEADGNLCTIPQVADILWSQAMLDASTLDRSPDASSYYLSALTELLIDPHKRGLPLLDVLVELNNRIYEWNRTNTTKQYKLLLKHTLRKKLFLSPR
ncbi:CASP8 and FADD-like apoptosis regulator isoform X2 [Hemicordylus capensis]|uniref:CASP8 and FADD-like apoptosis regulator isoform X2 n=1 Tax=Hemicordylus capensis TaxID=884348 RepID=UPI00230216B4|nr:CASP8 and FADD-like apoptosis regulator isoform X2 [Hemicordylus capensis]